MTDLERNDGLDRLSSAQLEDRAFGRAPLRDRVLRGTLQKTAPAPVARPERPPRRFRMAALAALALACGLVGAGVTLLVTDPDPNPDYSAADEIDFYIHDGAVMEDGEVVVIEDIFEDGIVIDDADMDAVIID